MHVVVLVSPHHHPYTQEVVRLWRVALEAEGATTQLVGELDAAAALDGALPGADLVLPHVLVEDYVGLGATWTLALAYEAAGVPMTNGTAALALCADKWLTHLVWARAGLPQPRTWALDGLGTWPGGELVVKPSLAEGGRGVTLAASLEAAHAAVDGWAADGAAHWLRRAVVQEPVHGEGVLRVLATRDRVVAAAEKPQEGLTSGPHGRFVEVGDELEALATALVRAVGGGLVGLDLLRRGGDLLALEANPPFGLPEAEPGLHRALARAALALA